MSKSLSIFIKAAAIFSLFLVLGSKFSSPVFAADAGCSVNIYEAAAGKIGVTSTLYGDAAGFNRLQLELINDNSADLDQDPVIFSSGFPNPASTTFDAIFRTDHSWTVNANYTGGGKFTMCSISTSGGLPVAPFLDGLSLITDSSNRNAFGYAVSPATYYPGDILNVTLFIRNSSGSPVSKTGYIQLFQIPPGSCPDADNLSKINNPSSEPGLFEDDLGLDSPGNATPFSTGPNNPDKQNRSCQQSKGSSTQTFTIPVNNSGYAATFSVRIPTTTAAGYYQYDICLSPWCDPATGFPGAAAAGFIRVINPSAPPSSLPSPSASAPPPPSPTPPASRSPVTIDVTCEARPATVLPGQAVQWVALVVTKTGSVSSLNLSWSGDEGFSATGNFVTKTYTNTTATTVTKNAHVEVTAPEAAPKSANCQVSVLPTPPTTTCPYSCVRQSVVAAAGSAWSYVGNVDYDNECAKRPDDDSTRSLTDYWVCASPRTPPPPAASCLINWSTPPVKVYPGQIIDRLSTRDYPRGAIYIRQSIDLSDRLLGTLLVDNNIPSNLQITDNSHNSDTFISSYYPDKWYYLFTAPDRLGAHTAQFKIHEWSVTDYPSGYSLPSQNYNSFVRYCNTHYSTDRACFKTAAYCSRHSTDPSCSMTLVDPTNCPPSINFNVVTHTPLTPVVDIPRCISAGYNGRNISISWVNNLAPVSYVDISTDSNFASYYHRGVSGSKTVNGNSFRLSTGGGSTLTYSPGTTYYLRTYNGTSTDAYCDSHNNCHSSTVSFTIPVCASSPPTSPPPVTPTVDLKINGSDGTISVASGASAFLSWTSANADSCTASGDWTGNKSLNSGASPESTGSLNSNKSYTLTCVNNTSHSSASDYVGASVSIISSPPASPPASPPGSSAPFIQTTGGDVHSNTRIQGR